MGTLIIYLVSIPLGIRKAVYNGSRFDIWSSTFIIIGYAIPAFLFAVLLIVFSQAAVISTSSAARAGLRGFQHAAVVSENHRLLLAHHAAGAGDGHQRFCGAYDADQKRLS